MCVVIAPKPDPRRAHRTRAQAHGNRLEYKLPELEEGSRRLPAPRCRHRADDRNAGRPGTAFPQSAAGGIAVVGRGTGQHRAKRDPLLRAAFANLASPCRRPQKRAFRNSVSNGIGQSATRDQSCRPNACFRAKSSERSNGTPCRGTATYAATIQIVNARLAALDQRGAQAFRGCSIIYRRKAR